MNTDTENFAGHMQGLSAMDAVCFMMESNGDKVASLRFETGCAFVVGELNYEKLIASARVNAKLFAASPDLLRERNELRAVLEILVGNMESEGYTCDKARKVLARCGK